MKTTFLCLAGLLLSAASFAQTDAEAVKKVCVTETENFDKRDVAAVQAAFADVAYASRYWPNNSYNGAGTIRNVYKTYMESSPQPTAIKRERTNWQLHPLGANHFWATYDQTSTAPDGKASYTKEVRLLERIGGDWKMVSNIGLPRLKPGDSAPTSLMSEFPALMKARNADAKAFFETRLAPDVAFVAGHDGSLQNKDYVMSLFKAQKQQSAELTNLKIQQVGDLAVATGVSTVTAVSLDGSKTSTYKDAFTYTLRWINNQWLFTNLHHAKIEYKL
jgi:ketosteroid isomerase-like protein